MSSATVIVVGLGMAALGYGARAALRNARHAAAASAAVKRGIDAALPADLLSKYYRGGFEAKMSKTEAAKILGVSVTATGKRVKEAHKRVMIANHPDKGGSPYVAAKINEAKDMLDNPR